MFGNFKFPGIKDVINMFKDKDDLSIGLFLLAVVCFVLYLLSLFSTLPGVLVTMVIVFLVLMYINRGLVVSKKDKQIELQCEGIQIFIREESKKSGSGSDYKYIDEDTFVNIPKDNFIQCMEILMKKEVINKDEKGYYFSRFKNHRFN